MERYGASFGITEESRIKETIRAADAGGYRDKKEVYAILVAELAWQDAPSSDDYARFWLETFPACIRPMEYARDLLEQLQTAGVRLGLVTNGTAAMQHAKIDSLQLRGFFHTIAVSGEVGIKKPDPGIFRIALEGLGATPAETWFVGDHPRNDIAASKAVGCAAVWLRHGHEWDEDQPCVPDYSISELRELGDLLGLEFFNRERAR